MSKSQSVDLQGLDINLKSPEEIMELIKALNQHLDDQTTLAIQNAAQEMTKIAISVGFENVSDFLEHANNIGIFKKTTRTSRKSKFVPVTHRDPDNFENTWTSRGKTPRWLQAKLDEGAILNDFRLSDEDIQKQITAAKALAASQPSNDEQDQDQTA